MGDVCALCTLFPTLQKGQAGPPKTTAEQQPTLASLRFELFRCHPGNLSPPRTIACRSTLWQAEHKTNRRGGSVSVISPPSPLRQEYTRPQQAMSGCKLNFCKHSPISPSCVYPRPVRFLDFSPTAWIESFTLERAPTNLSWSANELLYLYCTNQTRNARHMLGFRQKIALLFILAS